MSLSRFEKRRQLNILSRKLSVLILDELMSMLEDEFTKKKRIWTRKWIIDKPLSDGSAPILTKSSSEDLKEFQCALRMTPEIFDELLSVIANSIQRQDTLMRDALPAKLKLQITLSYLATGNSFRSLSNLYQVSMSSISHLIPEVCLAIYETLKDCIKMPSTKEEWDKIAAGFRTKWNFPSCYGAIDGKHVEIKSPVNNEGEFFTYKKKNSIVLMAIADDDHRFTYINVGANGYATDVFKNCTIHKGLEKGLILPKNGVIVGDSPFPLKTYLMKPYPGENLGGDRKEFNLRLSGARNAIDNAFGILVSRFRVFEKPIATKLNTADAVVSAACTLHNWLQRKSDNYMTPTCVDREDPEGNFLPGTCRSEITVLKSISNQGSNHSSTAAREKREVFKNYFSNTGSLPWPH